eukprot:CAMPEP_0185038794 /NCGR_PEP_ID=MMETSP1103-20130426/34904_1 /TAXON_ID=36769 /ORGANISM="Paraphysomonas bandaiensis, Strain Caron Lab Isolate" /LENGTH=140 /DNA_ID=CAMNT_0027577393 /DNA_START=45 /DNA_END=464 /DNA_ORIENTATION=+
MNNKLIGCILDERIFYIPSIDQLHEGDTTGTSHDSAVKRIEKTSHNDYQMHHTDPTAKYRDKLYKKNVVMSKLQNSETKGDGLLLRIARERASKSEFDNKHTNAIRDILKYMHNRNLAVSILPIEKDKLQIDDLSDGIRG